MKVTSKKCHWFTSLTGRKFYAIKALNKWRLVSKKGHILYEDEYLKNLKHYVITTFGWEYQGYM